MNCSVGYTNIAEFRVLDSCDISILTDHLFRFLCVISSFFWLIAEVSLFVYRYQYIKAKRPPSLILLVWIIAQNIIMLLRPIMGVSLDMRASTDLAMAIITSASAASATMITILFIYIEMSIISKVSRKIKQDGLFFLKYKGAILGAISGIQLVLFLGGAFLSYYIKAVKYSYSFWIPVILITFIVIPYFCGLGIYIYNEIRKMNSTLHDKLGKHILVTVIICGSLGCGVGVVAIYATLEVNSIDWIFVKLAWIVNLAYNAVIFIMISRKQLKASKNIPRQSSPNTPHSS